MLELRNVSYSAGEDDGAVKDILTDVSLKVSERFVAITGPNGGGKSTLAKLVAGIIKPTSGRIYFDGEDVTDLGVTERAKLGISYAFQQPVRFKGIRVFDLLQLASGRKLTVGEACEYLSRVGMCARDYVNREVNASLSGGELKRIEIATILARGQHPDHLAPGADTGDSGQDSGHSGWKDNGGGSEGGDTARADEPVGGLRQA